MLTDHHLCRPPDAAAVMTSGVIGRVSSCIRPRDAAALAIAL